MITNAYHNVQSCCHWYCSDMKQWATTPPTWPGTPEWDAVHLAAIQRTNYDEVKLKCAMFPYNASSTTRCVHSHRDDLTLLFKILTATSICGFTQARINCASVIPRYSIERITVFFISPSKGTACNDKKRQIEDVRPRRLVHELNVIISSGDVLFFNGFSIEWS